MNDTINIEDLIQDDHNFNKGTVKGEALMEKSFSELGAGRSILIDKDNRIIAGNKSQKAAEKSGIKKVIVVETDGSELIAVKRRDIDLNSESGRKLALADNSTASANLAWDGDELQTVMENLQTGFDPSSFGLDYDRFTSRGKKREQQTQKNKTCTCPKCGLVWIDN